MTSETTAQSEAPGRSSDGPTRAALRIVFMGTPRFAVPSLRRLAAGRHPVIAVVTQPDRATGRGRRVQPPAVKEAAIELCIPVLQPERARDPDFAAELQRLAPDLCVVVAYGQILPRTVLDIPRLGCINAHASLLPHLRGAAPIQRALLAGDAETGVTIMRINERMDAGDVHCARHVSILPSDDSASLSAKLAELSAELLEDTVEAIADGRASATPQDDAAATYAPMLKPEEREIDWTQNAASIERRIRAFRPEPGAFTFHDGERLKILDCAALDVRPSSEVGAVDVSKTRTIEVSCGAGRLVLRTVQPESGRPMPAADYFRGRGANRSRRLGTRKSY
jgi:methionyl-tRNA formyltransferase